MQWNVASLDDVNGLVRTTEIYLSNIFFSREDVDVRHQLRTIENFFS